MDQRKERMNMKVCPKCGKKYDDSWGVCISCDVKLVGSVDIKVTADGVDRAARIARMKMESDRILCEISDLQLRLSVLKDSIASEEALPTDRPDGPNVSDVPSSHVAIAKNDPRSVEQVIGATIFNVVGVFFLVFGFSLFSAVVFSALSVAGRVVAGYIACIAMIIGGQVIVSKEKFAQYGKVLSGGGWALAYYITYAIHNVPQACFIHSPFLAVMALLLVSAGAVGHMLRFRSEWAVLYAYFLSYISLTTTAASASMILATLPITLSAAYFAFRSEWRKLGFFCMAAAYYCVYVWTRTPVPGMSYDTHALISMIMMVVTFVIFLFTSYMSTALKAPRYGYGELSYIFNGVLAALISLSLLTFDKTVRPYVGFSFMWASIHLALTVLIYRSGKRSLYVISSMFAIIFAQAFVTFTFSGHTLIFAHMLIAELIFIAGLVIKEPCWRFLGVLYSIVIMAYLLLVEKVFFVNLALIDNFWVRVMLFTFIFILYPLNHWWYLRGRGDGYLPAESKLIRVIYYSYTVIYAVGTWIDAPKALIGSLWILPGVMLLENGLKQKSVDMRIQGYFLSVGSFLWLVLSSVAIPGQIGIVSYRLLATVPASMLIYYCVVLIRKSDFLELLSAKEKKMVYVYSYMVFTMAVLVLKFEITAQYVALAWATLAMIYALLGVYSTRNYLLSIASVAAILTAARAVFVNVYQPKYLVGTSIDMFTAIGAAIILYAGNFLYILSKSRISDIERSDGRIIGMILRSSRIIFGAMATLIVAAVAASQFKGFVLTVVWGAQALITLGFGIFFKEKSWRLSGLILFMIVALKGIFVDIGGNLFSSLILLGLLLLFVSGIYTKNCEEIRKAI